MKKSCKKCVALEGLHCRLGYPIKLIKEIIVYDTFVYAPAPMVECPKPLIYDDYHHGKRYKQKVINQVVEGIEKQITEGANIAAQEKSGS